MDVFNDKPPGFILVYELLNRIADHLHPIPPKKVWVTKLLKKSPHKTPSGPSTFIQELSDDEVVDVASIWQNAGLEPLYPSQQDWPKYKAAFEASPGRPDWELDCHMECESAYPKSRNGAAWHKHKKSIQAQAKNGSLVVRDDDLVPTTEVNWSSLISLEDARGYLGSIGLEAAIDLTMNTPDQIDRTVDEERSQPTEKAWVIEARKIADELDPDHTAKQEVLAQQIEIALKEKGVSGRGNKPVTKGNIIRTVLCGRKQTKCP